MLVAQPGRITLAATNSPSGEFVSFPGDRGHAGYIRAPSGLELSCPAAQATVDPFSRNSAGKPYSSFPLASRVSCSKLLGGEASGWPPSERCLAACTVRKRSLPTDPSTGLALAASLRLQPAP